VSVAIRNPIRETLARGEVSLGVALRQARTVDIAKAMKTAGYDWLFIDCEHNSMTIDQAAQLSTAALYAGVAPIVRVPGYEHWNASRALDNGALGVCVPHVETAELAQRFVSYVRYPPLGRRSVTGALPQLDFQALPLKAATEAVNAATMLVLNIESPLGVENAEAICAVPGVDAILMGTSDLSMGMGLPGQLDHPRIAEALERVVAACRRHDVIPGIGGVYDPPLLKRYMQLGFRMVLAGSDMSFTMMGARERARAIREFGT
jgi:2-keto-3-deoxy-L-rhamnonate aldolase RhmA